MFQLKKEIIANQEILTISHLNGISSFSTIKSLGAALFRLKLKDKNTSQDLLKYWDKKASFLTEYNQRYAGSQLFPFPNRLANGTYSIDRKSYQFPHNDFGRPNALHGHLFLQNFELENWDPSTGRLTLIYDYEGNDTAYPFAYTIRTEFTLAENSLAIRTEISNNSDIKIPFGYGCHPYFHMEDSIDNCYLELPSSELIEVDNNMIPTGNSEPFSYFSKRNKIADLQLDHCLKISQKAPVVNLIHPSKKYCISLNISGFDYLQVYIPPERDCIAIEPISCAPDAFNNGMGLDYLEPDNSKIFSFRISYSEQASEE